LEMGLWHFIRRFSGRHVCDADCTLEVLEQLLEKITLQIRMRFI
jgi:hypothetical protein